MSDRSVRLLAVVEVSKDERVYCQAPECTRTVYKRIHVVRDNEEIKVLGSDCYGIHYRDSARGEAFFGGESRKLTSEECEMLKLNTQALIDQFQCEHQGKSRSEAEHEKSLTQHQRLNTNRKKVMCLYCGRTMSPLFSFTPATGHKCQDCRDQKISPEKLLQPL